MADPTLLQTSIIIWVATDGDDTTGTGSQTQPYASIERALLDFQDGMQIRIKDGTYIPTDSIVISGMSGSIFAENPQAVYIQPVQTKVHQACVAILDAERFLVQGINILQAADSNGNFIGLYAENVENFVAYTCDISNFSVPSGYCYGIFAAGGGRVERCSVKHMVCGGDHLYGIATLGIEIIDCTADDLSGSPNCEVTAFPLDGMYTL
jgi:hypothetical protein